MKTLILLLLLTLAAGSQKSDIWTQALSRVADLHSYRMDVRSTNHEDLGEAGDSPATARLGAVSQVSYAEPAQMRLETQEFSDPQLRRRRGRAVSVYDGKFHYFEYHSNERNQRLRQDMAKWVADGQPFQGDYPSWGVCSS